MWKKVGIGLQLLEVRGLGRGKVVQDVSLGLHCGEILGVAGLVGAGRTELLRLIYGADRRDSGDVFLASGTRPAHIPSPMSAVRQGIGLVGYAPCGSFVYRRSFDYCAATN